MPASESASVEGRLRSRFLQLATTLGADNSMAEKWSDAFIRQYCEPQRHYHTLEHISSMLDCLQQCRQFISDETSVTLAIFFHDWIYDPRGKENEIESIRCFDLFAEEIGLTSKMRNRVTTYIECTISHTLPSKNNTSTDDNDLCLFLDFDLEVLSRPTIQYKDYAAKIRQEYSHVNTDDYRYGRGKVLTSFLKRDRLFFSGAYYESKEETARRNVRQEILSLEEGMSEVSCHSTSAH